MTPASYVAAIRQPLQAQADPAAALRMRAYLLDQFPFLGLAAPLRRQALKTLPSVAWRGDEVLAIAACLWDLPEREYRYVAIDLLKRHLKTLTLADLDALLALALREPWWETVDGLAGVIGKLIARESQNGPPAQLRMDALLGHDSLWLRRIAMLHQLGWRLATDQQRLFAYADQLAPESEFFIRKAIGWALRDYARWQPQAVRDFVAARQGVLSPLSIREACKHLGQPA